jgi:hypothetical protein
MDIRFVLPPGDERLTRLVRFLYRRLFRVLRASGVVLCLAAAVLVVLLVLDGAQPTDVVVLVAAVAIAALAFGYPAWAVRRIRRTQPYAGESWQYRLTEDGVSITGRPATQSFSWDGLQRVEETADDVYLLVGKYVAVQLPKQLLSEPDLAELRAFVAERGLLVGSR